MGVVTALAIASLVVAAGSAYMQNQEQQKARKAQKNASEVQAAQNQAATQADIRSQVRQQRVRTAQIMQGSANTGTLGSSGEIGGISALGSQVGSNVATISQNQSTQSGVLAYQNKASDAQGNAATFGAIGSLASSSFNVFSNTPQFKQSVNNLFA